MLNLSLIISFLNPNYKVREDHLFTGFCIDSRHAVLGNIFFAFEGVHVDGHQYLQDAFKHGCSVAVVQKIPQDALFSESQECYFLDEGMMQPIFLVDDCLQTLHELTRHIRKVYAHVPLIAMTGSCGKTSTRTMLTHVLSSCFNVLSTQGNQNNFLGVPLTLGRIQAEHEVGVIECGTNAPGELSHLSAMLLPDIVIITHIGAAHLEGLGDLKGVENEKISLANALSKKGVLIVPHTLKARALKLCGEGQSVYSFGWEKDADVCATEYISHEGCGTFVIEDHKYKLHFSWPGKHVLNMAMIVMMVCKLFHMDLNKLSSLFLNLPKVPGRLENMKIRNFTVVNDCYNANPDSMEAALDYIQDLERPVLCVLGDMGELGENSLDYHYAITQKLNRMSVKYVWFIGEYMARVHETYLGEARCCASEEVVRDLETYKEDAVLLIKGSRALALEDIIRDLKDA